MHRIIELTLLNFTQAFPEIMCRNLQSRLKFILNFYEDLEIQGGVKRNRHLFNFKDINIEKQRQQDMIII